MVRSLVATAREQPPLATAREHAAAKTQNSQKFKEKKKYYTISIVEIGEIEKKKKLSDSLSVSLRGLGRGVKKYKAWDGN